MADLRRSLAGLGWGSVRTYLQSGNVVFDAEEGLPGQLAAQAVARLEHDFGQRIHLLVLSAEDMARVVAANPFVGSSVVDEGSLHITFPFEPVDEATFAGLRLPTQGGEQAVLVGAPVLARPVVFLSLPHGYGRTKLSNAYFERALGVPATTRNWRTVRALAELSAMPG